MDKRLHTIKQMLDFLPTEIRDGLTHVNRKYVYEIRLRADKPTTVNYKGQYHFLGNFGLTERANQAIYCTTYDIADCVYKAGEYSVYSVEEQLKKGFITARNGERLVRLKTISKSSLLAIKVVLPVFRQKPQKSFQGSLSSGVV